MVGWFIEIRTDMADHSHIEWTEATWNPVTGCTKVSAGCKNCYAERLALRLRAMGNQRYRRGFRVKLHEDVLDLPRTWKASRRIFVNSMSDLFHPNVPLWFIRRVFQTMEECPQHTFQVLTKRRDRLPKPSARRGSVVLSDAAIIITLAAPVAQLDRVTASEAVGCAFEPRRAHERK